MSSKLFLVISHASLVVISLWCLVSIRDLRSVDKITTGSHVEGPHGQSGATDQQQHTKAVAVTTGYDTQQVQILHHGFKNGDAAFHDEILAMVKSPEIQFPCAQVRKIKEGNFRLIQSSSIYNNVLKIQLYNEVKIHFNVRIAASDSKENYLTTMLAAII
jgi:hypothetical protein